VNIIGHARRTQWPTVQRERRLCCLATDLKGLDLMVGCNGGDLLGNQSDGPNAGVSRGQLFPVPGPSRRTTLGQVRDLIEDWFSRLSPDAQADVRGRLRSRDDRQSSGAFFELYLPNACCGWVTR
jgi:hypothetical protein